MIVIKNGEIEFDETRLDEIDTSELDDCDVVYTPSAESTDEHIVIDVTFVKKEQ